MSLERAKEHLSEYGRDRDVLVVCAGDARVANPKFKEAFHCKAKMVDPKKAEELIGHAVGGVCPFGVNDSCKIYLDESLRRFETVFPACGSSNSAIELTPDELEELTPGSTWVDSTARICASPRFA